LCHRLQESTPELTAEKKNAKLILCRYCDSKILLAGTADFSVLPIELHKPKVTDGSETVHHHWKVKSQMTFENIGVTRPPPETKSTATATPIKYLACCDCDRGT
jgi:hypothetical protein